jgi:hypothetical protein
MNRKPKEPGSEPVWDRFRTGRSRSKFLNQSRLWSDIIILIEHGVLDTSSGGAKDVLLTLALKK